MSSLLSGLTLGFAAGISPGPLMALVVAESARGGWRRGVAAACAPPVTDLAILPLTLVLINRLPPEGQRVLSLLGGLFLAYLAWETFHVAGRPLPGVAERVRQGMAGGFGRGLLTNFLNPHPWLFWLTVGSPLFLSFLRTSRFEAGLFLAGFFLPLIGSKAALSVLVDRGVKVTGNPGYAWALRVGGAGLAAMAVLLLRSAFR